MKKLILMLAVIMITLTASAQRNYELIDVSKMVAVINNTEKSQDCKILIGISMPNQRMVIKDYEETRYEFTIHEEFKEGEYLVLEGYIKEVGKNKIYSLRIDNHFYNSVVIITMATSESGIAFIGKLRD